MNFYKTCLFVFLFIALPVFAGEDSKLLKAIKNNNGEMVQQIIKNNPTLLHSLSLTGDQKIVEICSPLYVALTYRVSDVAQWLIENNASCDMPYLSSTPCLHNGQFPLHLAVRNRENNLVQLMLKHGAQVDIKRDASWVVAISHMVDPWETPLWTCCLYDLYATCALELIRAGASLLAKDWQGVTIVDYLMEKRPNIVQSFVEEAIAYASKHDKTRLKALKKYQLLNEFIEEANGDCKSISVE